MGLFQSIYCRRGVLKDSRFNMSDAEGDDVPAAGAVANAPMDIYEALQKALDRRQAHLCILANSVDEPLYTKLIEALCAEHAIGLLKVDDAKKLGEWAGLCKLDKEGKARKVNSCGVVVVKDYGKESQALDVVREYLKSK